MVASVMKDRLEERAAEEEDEETEILAKKGQPEDIESHPTESTAASSRAESKEVA